MADVPLTVRGYCGDIPRDQRSNPDPDVEPPERALELDAEACLACSTVKIFRARIPGCSHWWCRYCLRQRAEQAVARRKDESLWPPRCCSQGVIVDRLIRWIRDRDMWDRYAAVRRMLDVPVQDRTFCHYGPCGTFIHADDYRMLPGVAAGKGNWVGRCPACGRETCVACRGGPHPGEDCPIHADAMAQMEEAIREKLQICWACGTLAHREEGCIHMTCACKYQFCWDCGDTWPCSNEHFRPEVIDPKAKRAHFIRMYKDRIRRRQVALQLEAERRQATQEGREMRGPAELLHQERRRQEVLEEAERRLGPIPRPDDPKPRLGIYMLQELNRTIYWIRDRWQRQDREDRTGRYAPTADDPRRRLIGTEVQEEEREMQARWREEAAWLEEILAPRREAYRRTVPPPVARR